MTRVSLFVFSIIVALWSQTAAAQGISREGRDARGRRVRATWLQPRPQGNGIRALRFVDARTGWAVGDAGTILHTTDGGQHWRAQESGTMASLAHCAFSDRARGWSATQRQVLRTTDAGTQWHAIPGPPLRGTQDLYRDIAVPAAEHILVVTRLGGIFRSTDSGGSWSVVHHSYEPARIFFRDALHGWVAGDHGRVARTTDGGATWTDHYVVVPRRAPLRNPSLLYFADSLRGWITADTDLYATTDGGRMWELLPDSTRHDDLHMSATGQLWSCGTGLRRSSDGGRTWHAHPGVPRLPLAAITFVGPDTGWAAGAAGVLLRSTDGGATWHGDGRESARQYRRIHLRSDDTVWVLGDRIHRSDDGGMHWIDAPDSDSSMFRAADFLDPRAGTLPAGTLPGGILRIAFQDPAHGYAIDADQILWSTTDGGRQWSSRTFGRPLLDLAVPDSRRIVLLARATSEDNGSSALVLRSNDHGQTWRAVTIDAAIAPVALCFTDARHGWLLADAGAVWTTDDGGGTWVALPVVTGIRGRAIGAVSSDRAYIAGDDGGIVRIDIQSPD